MAKDRARADAPGYGAWTLNWAEFMQRLDAFAADYCRVKPSLGMVGEILWVVGAEFEFALVPRDSDGSPQGGDGTAPFTTARADEGGIADA